MCFFFFFCWNQPVSIGPQPLESSVSQTFLSVYHQPPDGELIRSKLGFIWPWREGEIVLWPKVIQQLVFLSVPLIRSSPCSSLRWEYNIHEWHNLFPRTPSRVPALPGLHVDRQGSSGVWHPHQLLCHQHGAHLWLHHCVVSPRISRSETVFIKHTSDSCAAHSSSGNWPCTADGSFGFLKSLSAIVPDSPEKSFRSTSANLLPFIWRNETTATASSCTEDNAEPLETSSSVYVPLQGFV